MPTNAEIKSDWSPEASDELFEYGYSGVIGWLQNLGHRQIYRWLQNSTDGVFLDMGIGQGGQFIDQSFNPLTLIRADLSLHNLLQFKTRHMESMLVSINAESLPIRDRSVDHLMTVYMLEHIPDLGRCLREIERVLKPNGTLLVALPAEGGLLYKLGRELTTKKYMEKNFNVDYDEVIKAHHLHNFPEITEQIKQLFELKKTRYLPFFFLPSFHLNAFICLQVKKAK
jgi:ubiquinone/menaquinone biosynthesis C-methylase UbiE